MERNPGTPLDLGWIRRTRAERAAVERRVAALSSSPSGGEERETRRLLRAVAATDLTTLAGDDTPDRVRRLCERARSPLPPALPARLRPAGLTAAAVCVYPVLVPAAVEALKGSGIPVASVAGGFPAGLTPLELRVAEIRAAVAAGAEEIDAVIARYHVLSGDWPALYHEVKRFREAAGTALLKVILATGELGGLTRVARAARVCMMAGADFLKTSTGKERVNATLPVGVVLARALRDHEARTGHRVGLKAAGGISEASRAVAWVALVEEELGADWAEPSRFRIGASRLLTDIVRRLEEIAGGG